MKKHVFPILLALLLLLPGCGGRREEQQARMTLVATTYPVYLFASAVTDGVEGVRVERLNTGEASCLHDYTLSVQDMKKLELADVVVMNGVELEEFMEDALAASPAAVIDCSEGAMLLENLDHHHEEDEEAEHEGHDHGHFDPHIWMDPANAVIMVENLVEGLVALDPDHGDAYRGNGLEAMALLSAWDSSLRELLDAGEIAGVEIAGLITFHDGFQYFAHAYDLPLLESIEEEAGSEASAHEIVEITQLVQEHHIPVIFTEVNGSDATAKAIARETGCGVEQLNLCMDGPDGRLSNYFDALLGNVTAIVNGFAGEEVIQ